MIESIIVSNARLFMDKDVFFISIYNSMYKLYKLSFGAAAVSQMKAERSLFFAQTII